MCTVIDTHSLNLHHVILDVIRASLKVERGEYLSSLITCLPPQPPPPPNSQEF